MSVGPRLWRFAIGVAGPSRPTVQLGRRAFGFDTRSPLIGHGMTNGRGNTDRGGWGDEARNPVVRDSLVPIVVEQTVSPLAPHG